MGVDVSSSSGVIASVDQMTSASKYPFAQGFAGKGSRPSQHDTFDMKPDGPSEFKGEFSPIATKTSGIQICEHFPMLAQRSEK